MSSAVRHEEFRHISARLNLVTGQMLPLDPPVEVHVGDLDSWAWSWEPIDLLEWRIEQARHIHPPRRPEPLTGVCQTCGHEHA